MIYNLPQVKKAVGETWYFTRKYPFSTSRSSATFAVAFMSNGHTFSSLSVSPSRDDMVMDDTYGKLYGSGLTYDSETVAQVFAGWTNEAYRTITFLDPPTGDLLAWLQINAVKQ